MAPRKTQLVANQTCNLDRQGNDDDTPALSNKFVLIAILITVYLFMTFLGEKDAALEAAQKEYEQERGEFSARMTKMINACGETKGDKHVFTPGSECFAAVEAAYDSTTDKDEKANVDARAGWSSVGQALKTALAVFKV